MGVMAARPKNLIDPIPLLGSPEQLGSPLPDWAATYLKQLGVAGARKDLDLVRKYLLRLRDRSETFRAYRRDIETFLHWAWQFPRKRVTVIDRDDVLGFIEFIRDPPKKWIGPATVDRHVLVGGTDFHPNLQWRLFVKRDRKAARKRELLTGRPVSKAPPETQSHLSRAAVRSALAANSAFYRALVEDQVVKSNPVAIVTRAERNRHRTDKGAYERILSPAQWKACVAAAKQLAVENPVHERTLFIVSTLYLLKLRISEIAGADTIMNRFREKGGIWIFRVENGKRGKSRDVACPDAMLVALRRYRKSLGIPSLPGLSEAHPLLPKLKGRGSLGIREISTLLQLCFDTAARALVKENRIDDAFAIVAASAHWLRHTSATAEASARRPLVDLQHDLGHDSIATTGRYVHDDLRRRARSVRGKTLT
jgi:integrase